MRRPTFRLLMILIFLSNLVPGNALSHQNASTAGNPFPRKVLLELFTATWCGPCAEYGHLADELADEFGPDKVILVRNQCWKDGLNTPETDARADFYRIAGVPAMVTAGYRQSHPAEMEKNRRYINQNLAKNSPFRIIMQYTKGSLQINLQNGTDQTFDDLRLITLLYENQVWYDGQNGEKLHKKVVRDYIEDEQGLALSISSNETIDHTIAVQYKMKTGQEYYLVCFLQDTVTKEIYQAESIQATVIKSDLPDLTVTSYPLLQNIEEEAECKITLSLSNTGNQPAGSFQVRLHLSPHDDWDISDDVRMSETAISGLEAKQSKEVTFSFLFPDMGTGEYKVWMVFLVDPMNEVPESNENNLFKSPAPIQAKDATPKITPPVPVAPLEGEQIILPYTFRWSRLEEATKYLLMITTVSAEPEKSLTKLTNEPSYTFDQNDEFLVPDHEYRYAVIAFTLEGEKSVSSAWTEFSVKTLPKTYFPLTAKCLIAGILLQWVNVPEAKGGYNVYQKSGSETLYPSESINPFLIRETTFTITESLQKGVTYCFVVKPVDSSFQEISTIESIEVCLEYHPAIPVPSTIFIDPSSITIYPQQTKQFTALVYHQENQRMQDVPIQWSFLGDIGIINPDGLFFALKKGKGQVVARVNNLEARAEVVVINYPITVTLQIGNRLAFKSIHDVMTEITLESPPFIQSGYTMVPLRFIGEAFGAKIEWHPDERMILLELTERELQIVLIIDSQSAYLNGKKTTLEVPPVIRMGRTFVPLRFIAEAIGCSVEWEMKTQRITLVYIE